MKYLDRALLVGPHYCLCMSLKAFEKEMEKLEVPEPWPSFIKTGRANATTSFIEYKGKTVAIVTLPRSAHTGIQIAALLVHEAVHIWQEFRRSIGETNPGDETEAYAVQTISQRLMESYQEQTRNRRTRSKR